MLSKCYESTEVDRRTGLHVPSETHWSTSSDTQQVVEIEKDVSSKTYRNRVMSLIFSWTHFFFTKFWGYVYLAEWDVRGFYI